MFANKKDPPDVSGLVRGVLISTILAAITILAFYFFYFRGLV